VRGDEARGGAGFPELGAGPPPAAKGEPPSRRQACTAPKPAPVPLEVEVVWGDITGVEGDVYAVGHYQGVEPQNAEFRMDWRFLSDIRGGADVKRGDPRLPLTRLTRNGLLQGRLGEVSLFPGVFPVPARPSPWRWREWGTLAPSRGRGSSS